MSLSHGHTLPLLLPCPRVTACSRKHGPEPFVTLHNLRHVFVTSMMSNPGQPGPSIEAGAAGMLHSPRMWTEGPYDKGKRRRLQAANSVGVRDYLASQLGAFFQQQQQQAAAARAEEGESESEGEGDSHDGDE